MAAARSAPTFWEANAAANWNERATALAAHRPVNVARLYAYLSLAQLRAAEDARRVRPHPPTGAAIAAASAAVLTSFFAADAAEIAAALAAQAAAEPWPGAKHQDFAAGAALGRAAGARVLAYAQGDRFGLTDPGTPPTGPGRWQWSGGPIARGGLGARPFFVASGDALRPPPPPEFGSPAFLAALAEVRQLADTRTAEQLRIAQYWNANQSPSSDAARNNLAVELLRAHRRSDVESARILFLMNAAAFDAVIGCFAAKYHYWLIRPPQVDPAISLPIGLPPHPSYPSAHSCVSGASMAVLSAAFPGERARLAAVAEEASMSRLYAGIHYRFDMVAGLALGHAAAAEAMAADLHAVAVR
ncbi:MAG TPA: vanadium-dependent haloperoxidase [Gemmatirosa sp.]|nr:vanadium-dependent haloperoxidase [Gemmatirosa sp.]